MQIRLKQTYRIPQPAGAVISVDDKYGQDLIALGVADAVKTHTAPTAQAPADKPAADKPAPKQTKKKR